MQNIEGQAELFASKIVGLGCQVIVDKGDVIATVPAANILNCLAILRDDQETLCNLLVELTAVDWLDAKNDRFDVVYIVYSIKHNHRIRLTVSLPEGAAALPTAVSLYPAANFLEREVYDMFGITFKGHPDLRRIMMYDEFEGYPLRKDYPVQGKQPRIRMRYDEVHNTARDMLRPELGLVNIKKRSSQAVNN